MSGDLVAQDPLDGSILYLYRKGTQVKLRGQRIELGEIEHYFAKLIDDARWTLLVELVQSSGQDQTKVYLAVFYATPAEILFGTLECSGGDALFLQPMSVEITELRQKALAILHGPQYLLPPSTDSTHCLKQDGSEVPQTNGAKSDARGSGCSIRYSL